MTWDVLLVLLKPPQDLTSCRAGARPGHPISGHNAAQQKAPLFDHLVGACEKYWRHVKAERFGGLEVDHQAGSLV